MFLFKNLFKSFQSRYFLLIIISLLLPICLPSEIKADPSHSQMAPNQEQKIDDNNPIKNNHNHEHKKLDISSHNSIPNVEITIYPDIVRGWNLNIKTTNFTFTPENLNKYSNPNQGHAHLYVNGEKITRIYSNWYYIPELPSGENEIKVTLNTDSHEDLIYQGKIISDRLIINNQSTPQGHSHN